MNLYKILIYSILVFCSSCVQKPTKLYESEPTIKKTTEGSGLQALDSAIVVIDARPPFEYSLSHIKGSLAMRWEDFAQKEEPFRGLLEPDLYFHARRLARMGIGEETPILVVGRAQKGEGEEGRLAWTLKVLGMKKVNFTHVDTFALPPEKEQAPPRTAVPIWKPLIDDSYRIEKKEFLKIAMSPRVGQDDPVIIDVRTETEYLGKHQSFVSKKAPDLGAINIPWTEFIDSKGGQNPLILNKLKAVGITPNRKVICLDEKGVRSATVTLILRELGYSQATNFAGGYLELLKAR